MDLIPPSLLSHEVSLFDEFDVSLPCVGTIISSYLILTLASCVRLYGNENGKERNKLSIKVKTKSGKGQNSNSKLDDEQIRNISEIIFHPRFKNSSSENDLAILVLDEDLNSNVRILPILSQLNKTASESTSTFTNYSGRSCREGSQLSSLKISEPSQCPFSLVKPDQVCLIPLDSHAKDSSGKNVSSSFSCSRPFPGSSLICSDEERGGFLCGTLAISPENKEDIGRIYTNITRHSKWIDSVSTETKVKAKAKAKRSTPLVVVGGQESERIPYQLSIEYNESPPDGEWQYICGGVILDEKTAITAASCVDEKEEKGVGHYRLVAGSSLLNPSGVVVQVQDIIIHSAHWRSLNPSVAILHVDKFQLNKYIGGVWLSPFSSNKLTNQSAVISGWDRLSFNSRVSNSLQKQNVSILSPGDCRNHLSSKERYVKVDESSVCVLHSPNHTCIGDAGGLLVIQNYALHNSTGNLLVGINTRGSERCSPQKRVGEFMEISRLYNWIQENRATPRGCGGFIQLDGEKEIVYKVPEELRGEKSVCVWVVAAPSASAVQTKMLNNPQVQFQPQDGTLFAIYDFKETGFNHSKILSKDETWTVDHSFFVLYFRTSSSAPNSGFHIHLKEAGERVTQKAVKYFEVGFSGIATSRIQEFKYPTGIDTTYEYNERTFIILKPASHYGKLELEFTRVHTEENYDWIQIASVELEPVSHHRFTGWHPEPGNIFEVEEGEPFIIFFHSDNSYTGFGFKFSYSEQRHTESGVSKDCGGFIDLAHIPNHEIIYQVSSEEDQNQHQRQLQRDSICLWIVSTGERDPRWIIEVRILNNPSAKFNSTTDVLFVSHSITIDDDFHYDILNDVGRKYEIPGPIMTVYYRTNSSAPNAGFHLKLKYSILINNGDYRPRADVKLIPIPNTNLNEGKVREFSYPSSVSGVSNYSSNERTLFILKPQKSGAKIRVNLTFVDTEEKYDWIRISTYEVLPTSLTVASGRIYWMEKILEGLEDEPILFYFHSDELEGGEGFKIQYSEIMPPKPCPPSYKTPCGGFIDLNREKEIVYKVPENLRGQKSVCVWVVAAAGSNALEMEVLSNPEAQFQPDESTLFAIYNFRSSGFRHGKIMRKDKALTINQPFFVLYFRTNSSAPNSGVHIRLKEAGEKQKQKAVKYLELTPTSTLVDGAAEEFKYPTANLTSDERTFIIVEPATRHGKLKLDLKSEETEEYFNSLEILSVESKPISHLRLSSEGSWSNKSFEAEEDEPFVIYFHPNGPQRESRFQLTYSETTTTNTIGNPTKATTTDYDDSDSIAS